MNGAHNSQDIARLERKVKMLEDTIAQNNVKIDKEFATVYRMITALAPKLP